MLDFKLTGRRPAEALAFALAAERAGRLIQAARHGLAAGHGLTIPAWRMLCVASQLHGPLSIAQLARQLHVTRQSAQRMVVSLRRQEFVNVAPAPSDRRSQRVLITPQGAAVLSELEGAMRPLLLEVTNNVTAQDLAAATVLLSSLARRIRACETLIKSREPARSAVGG